MAGTELTPYEALEHRVARLEYRQDGIETAINDLRAETIRADERMISLSSELSGLKELVQQLIGEVKGSAKAIEEVDDRLSQTREDILKAVNKVFLGIVSGVGAAVFAVGIEWVTGKL